MLAPPCVEYVNPTGTTPQACNYSKHELTPVNEVVVGDLPSAKKELRQLAVLNG